MTVALAATFDPRGEIGRLVRLYAQIQSQYSHIIISLPPKVKPDELEQLKGLPNAKVFVNEHWSQGRYLALKAAYEIGAEHIHYCDLDRLIRWVETRPEEWKAIVERIQQSECLVIGRTEVAWATHPQVMIQVEKVINSVFSYLLEGEFDIGSGSKGFSRDAVGFILANSQPKRAIGTDAEWTVLLYRAGFLLESVEVDGLDWEIPDQYQDQAADRERQSQLAEAYDADVKHWFYRVGATVEVVEAGLDAMQRELNLKVEIMRIIELRRHTMRVIPGQHLSQEGVNLARRVGEAIGPFQRVITSTIPRAFETAIAMGFAVDEQLESLSMMGMDVDDEIAWDAGFAAWAAAAHRGGAAGQYVRQQAAIIAEIARGLPEGGAALVISHGGIVEAQTVGCLPHVDFTSWGGYCSYCEGARLQFDRKQFVTGEVLQVNKDEKR